MKKSAKSSGAKERPGAVGTYGGRISAVRAIGVSTDGHRRRVDTFSVIISISDKDSRGPLSGVS
jgi:hypothetical protein